MVVKFDVDYSNWTARSKKLKSTIQSNIQDMLNESAKVSRIRAESLTPIGKPITPEGDRTRPGHNYGDLRRGWEVVRTRKLTAIGTYEYESGLSHDAIGNNSTGKVILRVLEAGAKAHPIYARMKLHLTFFDVNNNHLVTPLSVKHPGTGARRLLTRVHEFTEQYIAKNLGKLTQGIE